MHTLRERAYRHSLAIGLTLALTALLLLWSYSLSAANPAKLNVSPATARQNDTVTLTGSGFSPGETVAVWITYPDFRVYAVAELVVNADGDFVFPYVPDFLGATFTPTGKYTYTARGKRSGREVYAAMQVNIGAAPGTSPGVTVHALPGRDNQGSFFTLRGENYGGQETLGLWLRYPDNTVLDLGQIQTGPRGAFEYTLRLTGAPVGRYAFTARGLRTGLNGIAEFDLTVADLTTARGVANLRLRATDDVQRSYAIFEGAGFQPGEVVSIWVTLPDFSTRTIGDVVINSQGGFAATLYLAEDEPVGKRTFTAFGNSSKQRAITDFTLNPGSSANPPPPSADSICPDRACVSLEPTPTPGPVEEEPEPTPEPPTPTPVPAPYPAP